MPVYTYKARDRQGELVTGTLETIDEKGVITILDRLGYSIVNVNEEKKEAPGVSIFERFRRLEKREVILFTRQLATLLRTGTSISMGLTTVCAQTTNRRFKAILEDVTQAVHSGSSFSDALAKHPQAFSELFISMVRVGEAGGLLDTVLERLAMLGTQELEMQSRIRSALIYPIVLVVVAFIVVNFLIVGVLPKFVMVFRASGAELPLPTQIVLGLSWIIRKLWLPIFIILGFGVGRFRGFLRKEEGKYRFHSWILRIPIFGELYKKIQISRFTRVLSALVASGIPLLQALIVVEKTITNVVIRKAVEDIMSAITKGDALVDQFRVSGMFSPMVVQMISTGEKSGQLDKMLEDISSFYDPEIEYALKNLTALLEPFMLLTMGIMVAFIALSVLLPIFNLIKIFRS